MDRRLQWAPALFALLALVVLSGCAPLSVTLKDPEASLEYSSEIAGRLSPQTPVGQSFISRRPGLNGIQLWLRTVKLPADPATPVIVELFHIPGEQKPLARTQIPGTTIGAGAPVTIPLSPQDDPPDQGYYLQLSTSDGAYHVLGRAEDIYPDGELFVSGERVPHDAAFRLSYAYGLQAMAQDLLIVLQNSWLALPLLLGLWLPGRLLLLFVEDRLQLDWGERLAMSVGLSLAVIPVVMLWTSQLGIAWNQVSTRILFGLLAAALVGVSIRRRLGYRRRLRARWLKQRWLAIDPAGWLLLLIMFASLGVRLAMVRDLAAPAWIDSVHHLLITRLIMDQGALPDTYTPFAPTPSASYHPGFHVGAAVFTWLSGLDLAPAMLIYGQILNALSVPFIYLFTTLLTRSRSGGLFAGLLVGLFSPMPAYYTGWGRYTQLAGMLIVPVCLLLIQEILRSGRWGRIGWLAALAAGGLFLVHYRVAIFLAALLLAFAIVEMVRLLASQPVWVTLGRHVRWIGTVALGGILLVLPWFLFVVQTMLAPRLAGGSQDPQPLSGLDWGYLSPAFGLSVIYLAIFGLGFSLLHARTFGSLLALWTGLLFISANQSTIRLPLATGINKTSIEIILFVPLTILGGWFLGSMTSAAGRALPRRLHLPYAAAIVTASAAIAVLAAQALLPILNPVTILIRQADIAGLAWVDDNLPPNAPVLINPFLWGYGVYAGQDGGYYLSPLAGQPSYPPPVLYSLEPSEARDHIIAVSNAVVDAAADPAALYDLMQQEGIRYVYLGRRGGVISPHALSQSALFSLRYSMNGVYVFETR